MDSVRYITALSQLKLGRAIEAISSLFNTDAEVRYQLIANGASHTAEVLTREEVESLNFTTLWRLPSSTIHAKKLIGYLSLLDHYISLVEGRGISPLVTSQNTLALDAEELRSYWLSEPEYARKVRIMHSALIETVEMFALQQVLLWVNRIVNLSLGQLEALKGLTREDLKEQYYLVDSFVYNAGKRLMSTKCHKAYCELAHMPQIHNRVGLLFFVNPAQIQLLFRAQMGYEVDLEEFITLDTPQPPEREWEQLSSGLFIIS